MAEKIISPGVFTSEIDESFLPAAVGEIGAAIIGPTLKGPVMIPTVVSSYSEFASKFGTSFCNMLMISYAILTNTLPNLATAVIVLMMNIYGYREWSNNE